MSRRDTGAERGAVAVIVALLMVPLLGFAAIAIDVAAMWSARQRLQTSADSSALAIAQDCAHNNCADPATTAAAMTNANFGTGATATVLTPSVAPSTGQVKVRTAAVSHHLFAPVIGFDAANISASATATWGAPTGGPAVLPLTISICQFKNVTSGDVPAGAQAIPLPKSRDSNCPGWSAPGGFGWVDVDEDGIGDGGGDCTYVSEIGQELSSDPGKSISNGCSTADFDKVLGKTVLLPIFDKTNGETGTNAAYHVYGYAAFVLAGYDFNGNHDGGDYSLCRAFQPQDCLQGTFAKLVDLDDAFDYKPACAPGEDPVTDDCAPNLGTTFVGLTG
ncbi:Tad domain-containing protein [Microlunatus sp. Gsoil 973]|uniref:Tad domain-containing protein n=1 Tax=Microlunatus sp. Gsoil 973 TaxID=2672569 RepID=UPI0012B46F13|nr:Tad domain-containing protein [Microlunatus sp. Gsoil 973]QGN33304.1 hypothetical protein GJV80_11350 [Microlunatus sp. Gsoil 973]